MDQIAALESTEEIARRVEDIEDAFVTHWRHFGGYPGAALHDMDGVLWFESPIAHLPYNAVIRTLVRPGGDAAGIVAEVCARFRSRRVPFMWVIRPSDRPVELGSMLAGQGLDKVEEATGMDVDIGRFQPSGRAAAADIVVAEDDRGLCDYEELIRTYWSVPDEARAMIKALNRYWGPGPRSPGQRLVAYVDGKPVGKLFVNLVETPRRASVYGVAVLPEARGRGIATAMMERAIAMAAEHGARRMVLHSSAMARSLYERMGFTARCVLPVYATDPIFGTHHH